jgi:hypothetical protein
MSEGHIRASVEQRNSKETGKKSGGWMDERHLKPKVAQEREINIIFQ